MRIPEKYPNLGGSSVLNSPDLANRHDHIGIVANTSTGLDDGDNTVSIDDIFHDARRMIFPYGVYLFRKSSEPRMPKVMPLHRYGVWVYDLDVLVEKEHGCFKIMTKKGIV